MTRPTIDDIESWIGKIDDSKWIMADPEEELELTEEQQRFWEESNAQPTFDEQQALENATPEEREAYIMATKTGRKMQAIIANIQKTTVQDMQALYIAAYTGRQPGDVSMAELAAAQTFWNTHPEAVADVLSCQFADGDKPKIRQWIENAINADGQDNAETQFLKYLKFFGADLLEAYRAFDGDGRTIVDNALDRGCAVYSMPYTRAAILPNFTSSIIPQLSEEQKYLFSRAIENRYRPEDKEQAALFALYVMAYDMADDELKEKAAAAIGKTTGDLLTYIWETGGAPDQAVFPPDLTTEKDEKAETEKPETAKLLPAVKRTLEQKPAPNRTGYMPLALANVNRRLLGIPLDGQTYIIGKGEYAINIKLTVKEYSGLLPLPLDNWAEKVSTIIGQGRAEGQYYFEVTDIARHILYGDPLAQKTYIVKSGKNKGNKYTKLEYVSQPIVDLVDSLIDFMQGIEAEITYPIWLKDKKGKPYLDRITIKRRLITGAFRVEIGKMANYGHTTKNKQPLRVWGFTPISDKVKDRFAPVLYEIASSLGQIDQIPTNRADIRHYLAENTNITKNAVDLRDELLRQTHYIESQGGTGVIDVTDIEKRAIIEDSKSKTQLYRKRKERAEQIAKMVETLATDGIIYGNVKGQVEATQDRPAKYDTTEGRETGKYSVTTTTTRKKRDKRPKTQKNPIPEAE